MADASSPIMPHTKVAVLAILRADPSLDGDRISRALAVLEGRDKNPEGRTAFGPVRPLDKVVSFGDAASLTGCTNRTLRNWAKLGLIRFVYGSGDRAIGVSAESLQSFLSRPKTGIAKEVNP